MNLLECLAQNDMIYPEYENGSIVDVVRTIYHHCGYTYKKEDINQEVAKHMNNKKHILFILADGMGSNLVDKLPSDMLLKKNRVKDLFTVCPTTTGCILSTVATAEYPAKHGMIGWYNHNRDTHIDYYTLLFKERCSGKNLKELGIQKKDIYVCDSVMNQLNRRSVALFPEKIVDSDFSNFVLHNNRIAYHGVKDAFEKVTQELQANLDTETFTYLYIPYIDSESHYHGVYSKEVNHIIYELEESLVKLKQQGIPDLEIVIIADHGQIEITEKEITMDFEKYNEYFYALPGIDFGTATYYVESSKKDEFLAEFEKDFKDRMFIFETEAFIKHKIFGMEEISPYMKSNLGEYISFCKKGYYFVNEIMNTEKYIGHIKGSHSGFSKEELTIPLIVIDT